MMNKLFKTSMFGYKKKVVNEYIEELSIKTQKSLDESEDKIYDMGKEIAALKEKIAELENNAATVSNAIITAEKKAEEIVAQAQGKADAIISDAEKYKEEKIKETENETKEAEMRLRKLNEEIRQLKTNIILSANKYTKELDQLIDE